MAEFENGDLVREIGHAQVLTVMQTRSDGICGIQAGNDAATLRWIHAEKLELVQKATKQESGPGFYPARSIMD